MDLNLGGKTALVTGASLGIGLAVAQELARELNHGRSSGQVERLILVAPPAFMGLLNEKLDGPTANLVSHRFEKDYTKSSEKELAGHLESCIFL